MRCSCRWGDIKSAAEGEVYTWIWGKNLGAGECKSPMRKVSRTMKNIENRSFARLAEERAILDQSRGVPSKIGEPLKKRKDESANHQGESCRKPKGQSRRDYSTNRGRTTRHAIGKRKRRCSTCRMERELTLTPGKIHEAQGRKKVHKAKKKKKK